MRRGVTSSTGTVCCRDSRVASVSNAHVCARPAPLVEQLFADGPNSPGVGPSGR